MGAGAFVLAALSLVFIGLSVIAPLFGLAEAGTHGFKAAAVFSFCAPALALAGVVVGGRAMSRAKREKRNGDVGLAGAIVSGLCFVPAMLTALTCGVCSTLVSVGPVHVQRSFDFNTQHGSPRPADPSAPEPPPFPGQPPQPASPQPQQPPQLPPPPLPAAPRGP